MGLGVPVQYLFKGSLNNITHSGINTKLVLLPVLSTEKDQDPWYSFFLLLESLLLIKIQKTKLTNFDLT